MRCINPYKASKIAVFLLILASTGCGPTWDYRATTKLHSDGKVTRTIYQAAKATPPDALKPGVWNEWAVAKTPDELERPASTIPLREIPLVEANQLRSKTDREKDFVIASGTFADQSKIPDHIMIEAQPGLPNGKLVRRYKRRDFVLVIEHEWTETLTDTVSEEDFRQAKAELFELGLNYFHDVLEDQFGTQVDVAGLVDWAKAEGKEWLNEIADGYFAHGLDKSTTHEKFIPKFAAICERHGLKVALVDGKFAEDKVQAPLVQSYLTLLLTRIARDKSGKKLTDATVNELIHKAMAGQIFSGPQSPKIAAKYGDVYSKQAGRCMSRIVGLYHPVLNQRSKDTFHFELTVPGSVVETNGQMLAENRVEWRFQGRQAYPLGYSMHCKSFEPKTVQQTNLLGHAAVTDPATMVRFVGIVRDREDLLAAFRQSSERGSMKPLEDLRKMGGTPSERKDVDELFRILSHKASP